MIIILLFDIAPFPYKHAQRRIIFHFQWIYVGIHIYGYKSSENDCWLKA